MWERNAADDTFGFGVVFSDETLGGIEHADRVVHERMQREFARWDDIDVHFRGQVVTSGGHGFAAMSRKRLLEILQERCAELDVDRALPAPAPDVDELAADARPGGGRGRPQLGRPGPVRRHLPHRPSTPADCKYMWLGTDKVFDAFKFYIRDDAARRHADPRLPVRRHRLARSSSR